MTLHWITGLQNFDFGKTYYYSGPMSGYEQYNAPQFKFDVNALRAVGIIIESPEENKRPTGWEYLTEMKLWQVMMDLCVIQMGKCNGIIMMKGWPQSRGAVRELQYATDRNWPVYYYDEYRLMNMNKKAVA